MTTASGIGADDLPGRLADLLGRGAELPDGDRHLPECPYRAPTDSAGCEWCRWALTVPEIEEAVAVAHDARALRVGGHVDSVPAVVAYHRLREIQDASDDEPTVVGSVRRLVALARVAAGTELDRLGRQIVAAASPGGPLEAACLHTAGGLAAVGLIDGDPAVAGVEVPTWLRADLERLASSMSVRLQLAAFLDVVERLHHRCLPPLLTQPEWARRPDPTDGGVAARLRHLHRSGLTPGSLEELVVESMLDDQLDLLMRMGGGIAEIGPRVRLSRPRSERPHAGRTRELLWRVARIDWHLSLVDTGLATCWGTHVDHHARHTHVPWVIAVAVAVSHRAGLTSALHATAPEPFRDDPVN